MAVSIKVNMAKRLLLIWMSMALLSGVEVGASELGSGAPLRLEVKAIKACGLDNAFALSTNLFSGAAPEGDEGFEALRKLGIKAIITVDGSAPDVERAHKFGMRYVHLPHGYDGIPVATELELIKAAQMVEGPIYLHCHHGKHRGPAAAAVVCMATQGWTHEQADAWLRTAGTGTNYQGLYATVRDFKQPIAEELEKTPANFVEAQKPTGLVDSMVSVDETFDRIKSLRAMPSSPGPDNHLMSEATLLREHFREAQRVGDAQKRGADFVKRLSAAEEVARQFEQALSSSFDPVAADRAFKQLSTLCASCHKDFRDAPLSTKKSASPLLR